jgi:hypothetical protein
VFDFMNRALAGGGPATDERLRVARAPAAAAAAASASGDGRQQLLRRLDAVEAARAEVARLQASLARNAGNASLAASIRRSLAKAQAALAARQAAQQDAQRDQSRSGQAAKWAKF